VLVGLVLATGAGVIPTLILTSPCPKCLGQGLVQEPPEFKESSHWVAARDLIHLECDTCLDHGKVSQFKKWRWKEPWTPAPPIYRAKELSAFTERRLERIDRVGHQAKAGTGGHPPTASSFRPDLLPLLAEALEDEERDVWRRAAWTVAYMNHPDALPVLLRGVQHPDHGVQTPACIGLGWLGRAESLRGKILPALVRVYQGQTGAIFAVRLDAAGFLLDWGEIQDPSFFLEAMTSGFGNRSEVRRAMARFGRKDAVLPLIKQLAVYTPKTESAAECAQALEVITGENFGPDPVRWYRWFEKNQSTLPKQLE
jgi:hypothetical protein